MKPTKVITAPKPTPPPTAVAVAFANCGLSITQENTYWHETIFHFPPVTGAVDYAAFKNYSDPVDAKQVGGFRTPKTPNTVEISQLFFPFQNSVESFDLVAYSATAVICVQRITFTTNYLV